MKFWTNNIILYQANNKFYLNQDKLKQHSREEEIIKTTNVDEV